MLIRSRFTNENGSYFQHMTYEKSTKQTFKNRDFGLQKSPRQPWKHLLLPKRFKRILSQCDNCMLHTRGKRNRLRLWLITKETWGSHCLQRPVNLSVSYLTVVISVKISSV